MSIFVWISIFANNFVDKVKELDEQLGEDEELRELGEHLGEDEEHGEPDELQGAAEELGDPAKPKGVATKHDPGLRHIQVDEEHVPPGGSQV